MATSEPTSSSYNVSAPPTRSESPEPVARIRLASESNSSTTSKNAATPAPVVPVPPSPLPEWGSDVVPIKDFVVKTTIPGFAKVIKGSYMTLGSSRFSFQKQHQEVYIHSVKMAVKVLAHSVRRIETSAISKRSGSHSLVTRMYAVDQRLAIPITYQGWFELLSEDGKSARPIPTVHELSKVKPKRFLVRENIKSYVMTEESKMTFDKTRIVLAGEHLSLVGELSLPSSDTTKKVKLLRCCDMKGDTIYLSFDQKGMFTPIAEETDVTGVFNIRDVVKRFRLPLTVKLVQGMRPKVDPSRFTGLIRLDWVYTEETAFVCPIQKNQIRLLPVPTDANLQLVSAINQQAMKSTQLYQSMTAKCNRMIGNYNNTIHLIVNLPDAASKGKGRGSNSNMFSVPLTINNKNRSSSKPKSEAKQNRLMDEIDDLYGYVRDGGDIPNKFQYDSDEESFWEEPAYEPLGEFRARLQALEAGEKVTYNAKYQPQDFRKIELWTDSSNKDSNESTYGVLSGSPQNPVTNNSHTGNKKSDSKKQQPPPLPPRLYAEAKNPPTPPTSIPPEGIVGRRQSFEQDSNNDQNGLQRQSSQQQMVGYVTDVSPQGVVSSQLIQLRHPPGEEGRGEGGRRGSGSDTANRSSNSGSKNSSDYQRRLSKGSDENQKRHSKGNDEPQKRHSKESSSAEPRSPTKEQLSANHHRRLLARDFRDSDISLATKTSSSSSGGRRPMGKAKKKLQTLYL